MTGCIDCQFVVAYGPDGFADGEWCEIAVDKIVVAASSEEAAARAKRLALGDLVVLSVYWLDGPEVAQMPADYEVRVSGMQLVLFDVRVAG